MRKAHPAESRPVNIPGQWLNDDPAS